jgi:hypothetical protein
MSPEMVCYEFLGLSLVILHARAKVRGKVDCQTARFVFDGVPS